MLKEFDRINISQGWENLKIMTRERLPAHALKLRCDLQSTHMMRMKIADLERNSFFFFCFKRNEIGNKNGNGHTQRKENIKMVVSEKIAGPIKKNY